MQNLWLISIRKQGEVRVGFDGIGGHQGWKHRRNGGGSVLAIVVTADRGPRMHKIQRIGGPEDKEKCIRKKCPD